MKTISFCLLLGQKPGCSALFGLEKPLLIGNRIVLRHTASRPLLPSGWSHWSTSLHTLTLVTIRMPRETQDHPTTLWAVDLPRRSATSIPEYVAHWRQSWPVDWGHGILWISTLVLFFLIGSTDKVHGQVRLSGTLLGADNRPMRQAHLVVKDGPLGVDLTVGVDEHGLFSFSLPEPGGYGLYALGVHHKTLEVPLVLEDTSARELDIRLQPAVFAVPFDSLRVIGDFNSFSFKDGALPMKRQGDGRFHVTLETSEDSVAYQLLSVTGPYGLAYSFAGTQAHPIIFNANGPFWDATGDYRSVVSATNGSVEMVFDPAQWPPPSPEPSIDSSSPTTREVARIYLDVEQRERQIGERFQSMQGVLESATEERRKILRDSLNTYVADLGMPIKRRIETEQNPILRQWLLLRYFDELQPQEADSLLAQQVLREVSSTSPLWSYEAWSPVGASNILATLARIVSRSDLAYAYMRQVADQHPDPDVRAQGHYAAFYHADHLGDEAAKSYHYTVLVSEFGDTRQAEKVRRVFASDRAIQVGKSISDFSFVSLDSITVYTPAGLRGNTYLIDFWGTWCGPCVQEMPYLHKAYEKYLERGFEILSIAFLDEPADIEAFRKEQYPMPWLHTLVAREDDDAVRAEFELTGFPRPILVDKQGTIIAIDEEVRGEKLLETLVRVFGEVEKKK